MRTTLLILLLATGIAAAAPGDRTPSPRSKERGTGWLGVSIQDVTPRFAKEEGLKIKEGAYVNEVVDDSPADSAGVRDGDVITEFNGTRIETAGDLTEAVSGTAPGTKVTVKVNRKGEAKSITTVIGKQRRNRMIGVVPPVGQHMMVRMFGGGTEGMELVPLGKQLAEYFEVAGGKGVLVQSVEKGSAAADAGIKAGDVVTRIAGDRVKDVGDIHEAITDAEEGDSLTVELVRRGKPVTVTLIASGEEEHGGEMGHWPGNFRFRMGPSFERQMEQLEEQMNELPRKQRQIQLREKERMEAKEL